MQGERSIALAPLHPPRNPQVHRRDADSFEARNPGIDLSRRQEV
jgi:hypothetical protein